MTELQLQDSNHYDEMVTKALERLTRWAFPDSQIEKGGSSKMATLA